METVIVAHEVPDLLATVPPPLRARVAGLTAAELIRVPSGTWRPDGRDDAIAGHFGLLIVDGLLARRVHLGNRACVELLGTGDVLRPWALRRDDTSIAVDARWSVQQDARIAVLDRRFASRVAGHPEVAAAIMERLARRAQWLAFHLAVCQQPYLQTRLRVMFWYLADRWGRVTPHGVQLPLPLTHALLGGLVGARRPATTTALGELGAAGFVERQPDGTWLLHGDPPRELDDLHAAAAARMATV